MKIRLARCAFPIKLAPALVFPIKLAPALIVAGLASLGGAASVPPPGTLDPRFGDRGIVTATLAQGGGVARGMVLQTDGKIVVGGAAWIDTDYDFVLARLKSDGSFDKSFGEGGLVTTDFGGGDGITAVAVRPDGEIVVAGRGVSGLELARYRSDGSLDPTFGTGGKLAISPAPLEAEAMVLRPNGKILIAGDVMVGEGWEFALASFGPDGSIDTSFGTAGVARTAFGGNAFATSMALQPSGKAVLAGFGADSEYKIQLARFEQDGSLDPSFGSAGQVRTSFGAGAIARAVAVQPNGKIVVTGSAEDQQFGVVRYKPDGRLDRAFGINGLATPIGADSGAGTIALQGDGKILAAGQIFDRTTDLYDLVLVRLNAGGTLDKSFGRSGWTTMSLKNWDPYPTAIALDKEGIVVAGGRASPYIDYSPPDDLLVARYVGGNACLVPNVRGRLVKRAKLMILRASCRVGRVTRMSSGRFKTGRVISQNPRPGTRLRVGATIALVVSTGART